MKQYIIVVLFITIGYSYTSAQELPVTAVKQSVKSELSKSVYHALTGFEQFSTLTKLIRTAGLLPLVSHTGNVTIFAPDNIAFSKTSAQSLAQFALPEQQKQLQALLKYHIIKGKISAAKIFKSLGKGSGQTSFTTLQGDLIYAKLEGLNIILSDSSGNKATITAADTDKHNGFIHQISAVLKPSSKHTATP